MSDNENSLGGKAGVIETLHVAHPAREAPIVDRRASDRLEADYSSLCRVMSVSCKIDFRDVSRTGAGIVIRQGVVPKVGQVVGLSLMERASIEAEVVWTKDDMVGLKFSVELPDPADALHFDDLGAGYFRAVLKFTLMET